MKKETYAFRKFLLYFQDEEIEKSYREVIIDTTLIYLRLAWGAVILFGVPFGVLDFRFFGEQARFVIAVRIVLIVLATIILGMTWWRPFRRFFVWCPTIFILSVGSFCILQTALSPSGTYSPYIMGVFLAFCGIFCTAGMGFAYSFFALAASLVIFEVSLGVIIPVDPYVFLVYNFFYVCFTLAFAFLAYYIEKVSRKRFIVTARLKDSLAKIKTLSGLLPICASCKQIRDDKGYWNQIESYLSKHSDMEFSHGLCPVCVKKMYPDLTLKEDSAPDDEEAFTRR